jgi:hypothetical protein
MTSIYIESKLKDYLESHPNWEKVIEINQTSKFTDDIGLEDEAARAKQIASYLSLPIIGVGGSRVVLEVEGIAVKVPLESFGYSENENEVEFWNDLPKSYKKYFTETFSGNEYWVVQEKITPLDCTGLTQPYYDEMNKIVELLKQKRIMLDDAEAYRDDQWGKRGEKLVVLDYGRCYFK